ncbi:hypothetical protein ACFU6I_04215 [Streptomyces sp. NPDC057486]|uniref:hypothetical protein n=1 Tax=Streptomyces sp. NPDC057486 TaxID=3346145 RepID=UPI0036AA8BEB
MHQPSSGSGCSTAFFTAISSSTRAGVAVRLTGHSMRAGFITTSRKAGKRGEKIRAQSGHAENSPVFWGYIREADKWTDAASEDIGL